MTVSSLKRSMTRMIGPSAGKQTSAARSGRRQCRYRHAIDSPTDQVALVTPHKLIENTPLFAELTAEERGIIGRAMQLRSYRTDDPLFLQNEPSDALYLIQQGWVKLCSEVAPADVTTVGSGNSVGCTDFFLGRPRQMTARAAGEVIAWVLDTQGLDEAIAAYPRIGLSLGLTFGTGIVQFQDYLARGLAHIPLLRDLSEEERWIVAGHLSPHRYTSRETIYRAGDPSTGVFFIEKGVVWLLSNSDNHIELGPGQTFGEQAVVSGKYHLYTAQAATDVILWQLSAADFVILADAFPSIKHILNQQFYASMDEALAIASSIVKREITALQVAGGDDSNVVKRLRQVGDMLAWIKDSQVLF
jgi:CRP-like cAMP-binding protein